MDSARPTDDLSALSGRIGRVVRATRTAKGLSLGDLARASGLSKTILSRIEAGDGNPSIETLWRVAQALALPLGALLADDRLPRKRVVRAGEGDALHADSGMAAWLLHAEGREHRSEIFDLRFDKGVEQRSGGHLPGTEELVICLSGVLLVGTLGDEVALSAGDALWFAADQPHRYLARRTATKAIDVILYTGAAR